MRLYFMVSGVAILSILAAACGGGYGGAPTGTSAPAATTAPALGAPTATRASSPTATLVAAPTATSAPAAAPTSSPVAAPTATAVPAPTTIALAATATRVPSASATTAPAGASDYDYGYGDASTPSATAAPTGAHDAQITLQEWSASISGIAHAGQVKLAIKNQGSFPHSLAVSVGGQTRQLGSNVAPGGTGELTLELAAGEYAFWCPLPGHRQQGMEGKLQVQ